MKKVISLCWWCGGKLVNGQHVKKVINGSERGLHLYCADAIFGMDDDQWVKPRSYIETLNRRFYDDSE